MKKLLILAAAAITMTLAFALPASAQYDPMHIEVTPAAVTSCGTDTGQITVTAGEFEPGSNVTVTLQSDPVVLGTLVASATGDVSSTFNLPVGVTAGSHSVIVTGPSAATGVSETLTAAITVTIPAGCVSNVTAVPTTFTSGGSLPVTGSDNGMFLAAGAGLLVAGGLLVMAARKRRPATDGHAG